jgi:5'-nucleotidase
MDYTLAQYYPEFDLLAYAGAAAKLVDMGYPKEVILGRRPPPPHHAFATTTTTTTNPSVCQVLTFKYDPSRFSRGLVLDKARGNILKMDRYKYVRVACHGSRRMSPEDRQQVYRESVDKVPTYTGREYVNVDTQFQVVDAALFEQLVDLKDRLDAAGEEEEEEGKGKEKGARGVTNADTLARSSFVRGKSYWDLFTDIRACVDLCHRDGVIKDEVARNPKRLNSHECLCTLRVGFQIFSCHSFIFFEIFVHSFNHPSPPHPSSFLSVAWSRSSRYVIEDPNLFPMLQQFRLAGTKVFLLTNSFYDYTDTVMTFLLDAHYRSVAAQKSKDIMTEQEEQSEERGRGGGPNTNTSKKGTGSVLVEPRRAQPGEWAQHFDLVVVGACKPAFMQEPSLSLFRVEPHPCAQQSSASGPEPNLKVGE